MYGMFVVLTKGTVLHELENYSILQNEYLSHKQKPLHVQKIINTTKKQMFSAKRHRKMFHSNPIYPTS